MRTSVYPILILARALARLPGAWALAVGRLLAVLALPLVGSRATRELEARFPGRGRAIAGAWLQNIGMSVCEFLRSRHRPDDHSGVVIHGLEHLPTGGGVLVCAHFGNFELMGSVISRLRRDVTVLVNEVDSSLVRFANATQRYYGIHTIYATGGPHPLARAFLQANQTLGAGHLVCVFVDAPVSDGLTLPFLDRPRTFGGGADALVARSGKPVVAAFLTRTPAGHLLEILPLPAAEATRAFVQLLDERVRARPDQYMWRW